MKGIAHFVSAVAAATFIPQVVSQSAEGSFILLLAGVGGIMPDTLDFRLARYLQKPDIEVVPRLECHDVPVATEQAAAWLGEQTAKAIETAYETDDPLRVRFHAFKLTPYRWLEYTLAFVDQECRIGAHIGLAGTAVPTRDDPASDPETRFCRVPIGVPTRCTRDSEIRVDALGGATLEFGRRQNVVHITFLPWHRRWSHSLLLSLLLGGAIAALFGPLGGLVYAVGSVLHILQDQMGHMGSSLLYPFARRRIEGFRLFHSGDVMPNLLTVWSGAMAILFNLDRFSPNPILNPWWYVGIGLVVPWVVVLFLSRLHRQDKSSAQTLRVAEPSTDEEEIGS